MPDLARATTANQIWITRGHLAALAVATTAIAVLAFLVGIEVGRAGDPDGVQPDPAAAAAFLPDASDEEALEALLRQVEDAQAELERAKAAQAQAGEVTFNQSLAELAPPEVPEAPPPTSVVTEVAAASAAPPDPPQAPSAEPPSSGWAVQIASYEDAAEADAHVARLVEQDLAAYRVAALISGQTWYRVRIGGFSSKEAAADAREALAQQLGAGDLMVAQAP